MAAWLSGTVPLLGKWRMLEAFALTCDTELMAENILHRRQHSTVRLPEQGTSACVRHDARLS